MIGPASLFESRTACVTSPVATDSIASPISAAFSSAGASGSYTTSAASASGIVRVGTTSTVFVVSASTCSATGMMFLLLGRITTWSALTCSTVSSSSAVDGLSVWPPVTMPCTRRLENSSASPSPRAHRDHRRGDRRQPGAGAAGDRRLATACSLGDLLEQVGDADLLRPSVEVERDLDRGADVVGVDVAVPEPVAADDHDRVADLAPALLEGVDPVVGEVEEVHHLVALLADVEPAVGVGVPMRDGLELGGGRAVALVGLGQWRAVDDVQRRVEQQQVAGTAGVDHTGVLEHREQLGRAVERLLAGRTGGAQHLDQRCPVGRGRLGRLGRLAHDGEDRALDRSQHRLVGAGRRRRQRLGDLRGPTPRRRA